MRRFRGLLVVLLFVSSCFAQTTPSAGATTPTPGSLRILAPKNGDKITQTFVDFTYELAAPASAAGSPTFQVRLDASDPVRTTDTRYTFTGLRPGRHTLAVEAVDANNVPLQGSREEVHFTVALTATPETSPPTQRPSTAQLISAVATENTQAHLDPAAWQQSDAGTEDRDSSQTLPQSSSSLPLLSLIGFSGLVGGVISAWRTRRR